MIAALGTPVFGRVDADKNIITSGDLADGTYTYWYEGKDGKLVEIGTVEIGGMSDSGSIDLKCRSNNFLVYRDNQVFTGTAK